MQTLDWIAAKSNRENIFLWLPFKAHMLDTAEIIALLYYRWLPAATRNYISAQLNLSPIAETAESHACNFCKLLALLHDIGKLTPAFQCKIAEHIEGYPQRMQKMGFELYNLPERNQSPHFVAGEAILQLHQFPKEFTVIIGSHHGKRREDPTNQMEQYSSNYFGLKNCNQQIWQKLWNDWIVFSLETTEFSLASLPKPNVKVQMLLTGLLIMADWIASNPDYFPYIESDTILQEDAYAERVNFAWNKLALPETWYSEIQSYSAALFRERFGDFSPNSVQQMVMDTVSENLYPGIYILEAPMGVGKTESALAACEILAAKFGAGGIFFGLPTQATANGIFKRIREWASGCDTETHAIRLAHGMVELNDEYQAIFHGNAADSCEQTLIVHEWFEGRKQALLSDFVIATVDQFLLASLKQKHVMLRHLGLAGKVIIIDECHAYDAYMNVYLDHALTWMGAYEVPVIILSATLPAQRRDELIRAYLGAPKHKPIPYTQQCDPFAYPVLTWTSQNSIMQQSLKTTAPGKHISVTYISEAELADVLSQQLSDGGCAAVIVNTIRYAQFLSDRLAAELPDCEIVCFHSRFIATDRAEIERQLLNRVGKQSISKQRNRLIVVGTQVLEQSLDLDFDYMVTELCPMDLLLQRSGRLHRHNRNRPAQLNQPVLAILQYDEPPQNKIYNEWILRQTAANLPNVLTIPECIPMLVSKVYDAVDENDPLYTAYCRERHDKEIKAAGYCIQSELLRNRRKNLLSDYLNDDRGSSEHAEASVRDSEETVEVLVLRRLIDGSYATVSGSLTFDPTQPLHEQEARSIAKERLRLPLFFSKYHFHQTLQELEVMPVKWRESRWLSGEMLLLLDENSEVQLVGKTLCYNRITGLLER